MKYHFGPLDIGSDIPLNKVDFPKRVSGSLYINKYDRYDEFKQGAVLSQYVDGDVYISNSPSLSGLTLPEELRNLYLREIETTIGLRLPNKAKSISFGYKLKSINGFVIPENYIDTNITFDGVNSKFVKEITIPKSFKGTIGFRNRDLKYNLKDNLTDKAKKIITFPVAYPIWWVFRNVIVGDDAQLKGLFSIKD